VNGFVDLLLVLLLLHSDYVNCTMWHFCRFL
jgi:hypothetical protein